MKSKKYIEYPKIKYCQICNFLLSRFNKDKVCFHHKEHKKFGDEIEIRSKYTGLNQTGKRINLTNMDYHGDWR